MRNRSEHRPPDLPDRAPRVLVFTDGGCAPNPGPGGWAAILWSPAKELEIGGGARQSTNNRMEMTAALEALRALRVPCEVTIVTDSEYLLRGMTEWSTAWSRRGWTKARGELLNPDLWEALARESLRHRTHWSWTRGHAGHEHNERCDRLVHEVRGRETADGKPVHRVDLGKTAAPDWPADRKLTATLWLEDRVD